VVMRFLDANDSLNSYQNLIITL